MSGAQTRGPRASLWEMALTVGEEAQRIRTTQKALVSLGCLTEPHPDQIRKAEVYEDIQRLVLAIDPVKNAVGKILEPVLKAMRTADEFQKPEPEQDAPDATEEEDQASN